MGIGLGSYFGEVWILISGEPEGPSLHSFYISLLFKGGLVLTTLYGWYVLSIGWAFIRLRKNVEPRFDAFITLGLAVLIGALVFQIAYGVSLVLMVFTGALLALGLADIRENGQGIRT